MESEEEKNRVRDITDIFSKGILYHFTSFGISKVFGIAFTIVLLNYFSAYESDLYFTANAFVATISSLAGLGLGVAAVKFLPGMILRKEGSKIKTEILSATVLVAAIMVLLFVIGYIVPNYISEIRLFDFGEFSDVAILTFALAFVILESSYISAVLNAFKEFFATSMLNALVQIVRLIFLFGLIYFGATGAAQMLGGYGVSYLVATVYLLWVLRKRLSKIAGEARINFIGLTDSIKFGMPVYLSGIIETFLTHIDVIMIAYFLGDQPGVVSGYTAAVLIIRNIAPMIVSPLMTVQQPILVEEHERKSGAFLKITKEVSRWAFYLGLPVLLVFMAFDVAFMQIIAKDYVENAVLIWLFSPLVIFTFFGISARNALMARGHVKTLFAVSLIMVAINLVANYVLIQSMGVAGAAIASSISIVVGESMIVWFANRKFGAVPHMDIAKALFAFAIALGVAFVNLPYFGQLPIYAQEGVLNLVVSMTIVCVVYLAVLFLLKGFVKRDFETGLRFLEKNKLVWLAQIVKPLCDFAVKYTG